MVGENVISFKQEKAKIKVDCRLSVQQLLQKSLKLDDNYSYHIYRRA